MNFLHLIEEGCSGGGTNPGSLKTWDLSAERGQPKHFRGLDYLLKSTGYVPGERLERYNSSLGPQSLMFHIM